MTDLEYFNSTIVNPVLAHKENKLVISNKFFLSGINLVISYNNLKSEEELEIVHSMHYLDIASGQKPCLKKSGYVYVGSKKVFRFTGGVSLRKARLYSFFYYLLNVVLPNYTRRYGTLPLSDIKSKCFEISIADISLFHEFKHSFAVSPKLKIQLHGLEEYNLHKQLAMYGIIINK